MRKLLIYGPPLLIVILGAAAYIVVVKLSTPDPIVVRGTPQSTVSASQNSSRATDITTDITPPNSAQITTWQQQANQSEDWRHDPLQAAKEQSLDYGFAASDPFRQLSSEDQPSKITAEHGGVTYTIVMEQVGEPPNQIWYISQISPL